MRHVSHTVALPTVRICLSKCHHPHIIIQPHLQMLPGGTACRTETVRRLVLDSRRTGGTLRRATVWDTCLALYRMPHHFATPVYTPLCWPLPTDWNRSCDVQNGHYQRTALDVVGQPLRGWPPPIGDDGVQELSLIVYTLYPARLLNASIDGTALVLLFSIKPVACSTPSTGDWKPKWSVESSSGAVAHSTILLFLLFLLCHLFCSSIWRRWFQ
jgi:hypothetical protein